MGEGPRGYRVQRSVRPQAQQVHDTVVSATRVHTSQVLPRAIGAFSGMSHSVPFRTEVPLTRCEAAGESMFAAGVNSAASPMSAALAARGATVNDVSAPEDHSNAVASGPTATAGKVNPRAFPQLSMGPILCSCVMFQQDAGPLVAATYCQVRSDGRRSTDFPERWSW